MNRHAEGREPGNEGAEAGSPGRSRAALIAAGLAFVVALALLVPTFGGLPFFDDSDAYYHLAVARQMAEQGVVERLEWARFSLLADGFGDKELLFHAALVPFVRSGEPERGGRLAMATFAALLAAVLAGLGVLAAGPWGAALPFVLYLGSADWMLRVARLRPESLSLLLLLLALAAIGARRYRWLAPLGLLYALSYTAFQAFLGLCGLVFLVRGALRRRWDFAMPLYGGLGVSAGLLLHPGFPDNLVVWAVQNLRFFELKAELPVGKEILPETTDELLLFNLGWWLLAALVLWRMPRRPLSSEARSWVDAFVVASVAFGLLYLLMLRFALYFFPFASLAVLFAVGGRGGLGKGDGWQRDGLRAAAVLVCVALSAPAVWPRLGLGEVRDALRWREPAWAEFGEAIPDGARVAARWHDTHVYAFYAPRALFLNVLDPIFMAIPHPEEYEILTRIFEGEEPDVPRAVRERLQSEFLAFAPERSDSLLLRRLAADPRVTILRGPPDVLAHVAGEGSAFVRRWVPVASPSAEVEPARPEESVGPLPAYVDVRGLLAVGECIRLGHGFEVGGPESRWVELASHGPAILWLDGRRQIEIAGDLRAVPGEGIRRRLDLEEGAHTIVVETCRSRAEPDAAGFYLLDRTGSDGSSEAGARRVSPG